MYRRPLCLYCKHFIEMWYCKAFPKEIPDVILRYEHDHKTPIEGDNGIQYEPKPKEKE